MSNSSTAHGWQLRVLQTFFPDVKLNGAARKRAQAAQRVVVGGEWKSDSKGQIGGRMTMKKVAEVAAVVQQTGHGVVHNSVIPGQNRSNAAQAATMAATWRDREIAPATTSAGQVVHCHFSWTCPVFQFSAKHDFQTGRLRGSQTSRSSGASHSGAELFASSTSPEPKESGQVQGRSRRQMRFPGSPAVLLHTLLTT